MNGKKATGIWNFHGKDHEINLDTSSDKLTIEVQDTETTDQWRASFMHKHIEDLTRKTGNFKHITVFVNMLESAVLKSSDSVTLELLTYNDLEHLRLKRNPSLSTKPSPTPVQSKRYLILTHVTEFDRIHYPLALPYVGKPDPVELQETIRHLQQELDRYKLKINQRSSSSFLRLQKKYDALLAEKEELEGLLEDMQQEIADECALNGKEDIMSLKNLIRKLEESSLKEKTKFQRLLSKKNEDIRALSSEVEDLRSSERLLSSRVKSLTNELAMMRRHTPVIATHGHRNKNSYQSNRTVGAVGRAPGRGQHSPSPSDHFRQRSSSVENHIGSNFRANTFKNRSRTPSPRVYQRFNPTAYIENKRRMQEEVDSRLRKNRSRSSSAGSCTGGFSSRLTPPINSQSRKINIRMRSRNSSVGSGRSSRHGSVESLTETSSLVCEGSSSSSKLLQRSQNPQNACTRGKRYHQSNSSTPKASKMVKKKQRNNYPPNHLDHSVEIKEIDTRLSALQQYMKSLERKK